MSKLIVITKQKMRLTSVLLWILSILLTLARFIYQDKTGANYPLESEIKTDLGAVKFKFLCSETIGIDLKMMFLDPAPEGISGHV